MRESQRTISRTITSIITFVICVVMLQSVAFAKGWLFVGPDSTNWRSVVQIDVSFRPGRAPYIGASTEQGICANLGDGWRYVLRDYYPIPPEIVMPRAVYFSPWNDSVAFVGANVHSMSEPGSVGGTVPNVFSPSWAFQGGIGGGFVGYSPSLAFEFSPHHSGVVYSWIVDLYRSSNNGTSWELHSDYESYGAFFLTFDQRSDSVLYAGRRLFSEQTVTLHRSKDNGSSWTLLGSLEINASYPFQRNADLLASGDTLVLATNRFPYTPDSTNGISVSVDRAVTWTRVIDNLNVQKISRDPSRAEHIYAATQAGIYRSLDGGVAWQLYTDSLPSINLVDIRKDPYSDTLYIATSDSGVYKVFDIEVGVREEEPITNQFHLQQNFPNPFNPSTTIRYALPERSLVTLKVYNVLGQEVATLVNEEREAGTHRVQFDGTGMASGVYLYRLQARLSSLSVGGQANDYFETKKLVLLK